MPISPILTANTPKSVKYSFPAFQLNSTAQETYGNLVSSGFDTLKPLIPSTLDWKIPSTYLEDFTHSEITFDIQLAFYLFNTITGSYVNVFLQRVAWGQFPNNTTSGLKINGIRTPATFSNGYYKIASQDQISTIDLDLIDVSYNVDPSWNGSFLSPSPAAVSEIRAIGNLFVERFKKR